LNDPGADSTFSKKSAVIVVEETSMLIGMIPAAVVATMLPKGNSTPGPTVAVTVFEAISAGIGAVQQ
jgi:hypothetical protein